MGALAIQDEINSLSFNKTWTLVSMPKSENFCKYPFKWVFTVKNDEFGCIWKARGFSQEYLTD